MRFTLPETDPSRWTEIFSPDLDCTVRNVSIAGVRSRVRRQICPSSRS